MKIEELFGVNKSNLCEKWFSLSALSREVNDKKTALIQKIEKMKKETSEQVGKVREETSKTLESLSKIIKKKEGGQ